MVVFYLTKVIYYQMVLVSIIIFFLISLIWLGYIDSGGQDRAILLALLLIILTTVFFFSCQVLTENLELLKQSGIVKIVDSRPETLSSFGWGFFLI